MKYFKALLGLTAAAMNAKLKGMGMCVCNISILFTRLNMGIKLYPNDS